MNPISDDELILYHYRDGLDPSRLDEIATALESGGDLRERHQRLLRLLDHVDSAPIAESDDQLATRIWQRLENRFDASRAETREVRSHATMQTRARTHGQRPSRWRIPVALATAASLLIAVAISFYAGRVTAPQPMATQTQTPSPAMERAPATAQPNAMATRVLDVYVAEHLRATEGLLLTAANAGDSPAFAGERDVAASLVESNRLYALAAARAGDLRLADFLRQIEPILIELANRPADPSIQSSDGLRDYLRRTDLLFQVRATQARVSANGTRNT